MTTQESMVFDDLALTEIPVTIGEKSYTLREASGDAGCRYRNALLACTQLGPEGKPSQIRGMADVEPLLISFCLFDEKGKPVKGTTIRSWPNRMIKKLFDRAKEISDLDEDEDLDSLIKERDKLDERIAELRQDENEDELKNSPSGMTDGSG